MIVFTDSNFRHIENKERVYDALDEFFSSDAVTEDEYLRRKNNLLKVLEDEPEIFELIREDLED